MISTHWSLIDAAARGDGDARERFAARYRPALVAYLRGRGLGDEAEDVAQEVFLRLHADAVLQRADPARGSFRSLLLAVTRNVLGHRARHAAAQRRGGDRPHGGDVEQAPAPPPDDEAALDAEWLGNLMRLALERLAREHPAYHEALLTFAVAGRTRAGAAAALGVSEDALRNRVHRGRQRLAAHLRVLAWDYAGSPEQYADELRRLQALLG